MNILQYPPIAGDVISGWNVYTVDGYTLINFDIASFSCFQEKQKQFLSCPYDGRSIKHI